MRPQTVTVPTVPRDSVLKISWIDGNGRCWHGSAVIVGEGRKLVTCGHCVGSRGSKVSVQVGSAPVNATVLVNKPEPNDLAVIEAPSIVGPALAIVRQAPKKDDEVYCIGFPSKATSAAKVSARIINVRRIGPVPSLQIDSPLEQGMSGGGLFDSADGLVGILKSTEPSTAYAIEGDFVAATLRHYL